MTKRRPDKTIINKSSEKLLTIFMAMKPCKTKQIYVHIPKYWNSKGIKLEKGLNIIAIIAKESLRTKEDPSSKP